MAAQCPSSQMRIVTNVSDVSDLLKKEKVASLRGRYCYSDFTSRRPRRNKFSYDQNFFLNLCVKQMPYGRRTTMRGAYRKRAPYGRGRTTVPRKKKTTRGYVRSNAIANKRQDRAISRLYKLRYGPLQRNLHFNSTPIFVNATQPIAFDASDFTCSRISSTGVTAVGCQVWQVNNLLLQITPASSFNTVNGNALWEASQRDYPDGGRYKPVYAEYQIEVSGRRDIDDCWVQMDLFTQHHGFQTWQLATAGTSVNQRVMPYALTNMGNMITTNELNPSLFKRYKRRRILLNSQTATTTDTNNVTTGTTSTTTNTKYFRFRVAPKRVRNQVFTNPDTPGEIEASAGQTQFGDYGLYQVDPRTPFWCMISATDRTSLDGDSLQINIRRHVVWRDINGGTNL